MNVVIVEDETLTALFIQEELEDHQHSVAGVFKSGDKTLAFLETNHHKVDVVFMDIQIDGALDGIEVAHIIHKKYPHVLLVFLTAHQDSETIKSVQSVQPTGFLVKPILETDIDIILMILTSTLEKQKSNNNPKIIFGAYIYNTQTKILSTKNKLITLTHKEQLFFHELITHHDTYISIDQLLYTLWEKTPKNSSSLRVLVYRLRKKIPGFEIVNTPNLGYILRLH